MISLKKTSVWIAVMSVVPVTAYAKTFADIVNGEIVPFGDKVIELLYILSFIFFLFGMVRYFFSYNAEKREQGKYFAIYGIVALALLFVLWGVVRFLIGVVGSFT